MIKFGKNKHYKLKKIVFLLYPLLDTSQPLIVKLSMLIFSDKTLTVIYIYSYMSAFESVSIFHVLYRNMIMIWYVYTYLNNSYILEL